ncbi:acetyl-CoA carboxylase biotin carboxylase subunit [Nocardia asteroides]|uniref:biotin carboxylase n=1 Tax=Nocardia asteroides NBRC 15531 TaxID=1110697 RepID=U5E6N7_NOCAS|nr:acetyl-CoA carboxylase biotin carboxylase subunit [Nocardia asteroides]GAD85562.1 acetyl-CoA carboxylase biotin carboxyl carrier protein [Nocardia asteroides NBRC 15531]SFN46406.1 acetyl-CoA carboxylase, biotin carboxylase subunit [Nocardia asteroides]VEG36274.1 Biotin carboxylase [Nocardia asteroides]
MTRPLRKVLIANRGEIAVRVIRTCRELGIATVAVHSAADRDSAAVRLADERVQIGPAPAKRSYLSIPAIIEAARATGADAIHPGYGFLSEDPDFAEVCETEGFVFVGAPAAVMARLGDKSTARALMADAGLPLLPGSRDPIDDVDTARALAEEIGYPVIIKAVAGGGGRGMRVVRDGEDFGTAWQQTRATAAAVFGDGRLYLERYLESARHVEVQILADTHGTVVHLGLRDCSLQRRHQKLVEEAPAPGLSDELAEQIGAAAVRGCAAAGYVGAGTVEFLLAPDGEFYFMEVNCRLQVEHPVTEMVTGVDLVAEQLRIAAGEPLRVGAGVRPSGVAIECRVNAEDPEREFAPAPGTLTECVLPAGPFVRVDTHIAAGYAVPPHYDSLLAKVVVWAPDRPAAIDRMRRALAETTIAGAGVATTTDFLHDILDHPRFRAAAHDTALIGSLTAR